MSKRIYFEHWGARGSVRIPAYAVRTEGDDSDMKAVARAVAAASGLATCGCSPQGTVLDGDLEWAEHYELTLGRPLPRRVGGGFSVEGSVWVSVPMRRDRGAAGEQGS
jgi:hypothetical protein